MSIRRFAAVACVCLAFLACSGPQAPQAEPEAKTIPKPKPADQSRLFPGEGRISMEIVEAPLLGKDHLPGGNLAAYEKDGKQYQLFLIATSGPDAAALLMFEAKGKLADAKFVPSFGGYFGFDGEEPWFIFPKNQFFLGVVGLEQKDADFVARDFAGRVN